MNAEPSPAASPAPSRSAPLPPGASPDAALLEEVDEYFEAGAKVEPGDVVVDVGANIGAFAMRAADRVGGRLTIHCFEPAPVTFAALSANLARHPSLAKGESTASCMALTRAELAGEERPFYYFARMPTNSTYDLEGKRAEFQAYFVEQGRRIEASLRRWVPLLGGLLGRIVRAAIEWTCNRQNRFGVWLADKVTGLRVITCKTDSLERWAETSGVTRIDLLKVDVEGAELDVLRGCGAKWSIVRQVALEAHDRDGRLDAIEALLRAQGLTAITRFKPRITAETGLDNVLLVAKREGAEA